MWLPIRAVQEECERDLSKPRKQVLSRREIKPLISTSEEDLRSQRLFVEEVDRMSLTTKQRNFHKSEILLIYEMVK